MRLKEHFCKLKIKKLCCVNRAVNVSRDSLFILSVRSLSKWACMYKSTVLTSVVLC